MVKGGSEGGDCLSLQSCSDLLRNFESLKWYTFSDCGLYHLVQQEASACGLVGTLREEDKEKMVRIPQAYGILKGGEHMEVTLYLISSDDWPRDVIEYTGRRHRIVAECLKIPDYIRPKNEWEAARIAREIFHYSSMFNPLQRMYTKISIVLE